MKNGGRGRVALVGAMLVAALVALPVVVLGGHALLADLTHWEHLTRYVLPQALWNTVLLLAGVGALCAALGTGSAWLVTAYDFPGRSMLTWALLLPLAVPT